MIDRQALAEARGENEWVVASIIDIRGFTSHSMEAVEAAFFLKTVYGKILARFVPEAAFAKLTGDGLLVVEPYDPGTLGETLESTINRWFDLVSEFRTMTDDDPEIRFSVPTLLGVGVEFGAASRLISGTETLDFFGKPLNVAARLCDLARPSGIVLSDVAALSESLRARFDTEEVYLKGISERTRVPVWYSKELTSIPPFAKYPLLEPEWITKIDELPMTILRRLAGEETSYVVVLDERPLGDDVTVHIHYTLPGRSGTYVRALSAEDDYQYAVEAGRAEVNVNSSKLNNFLEARGVRPRARPRLRVTYPRRPNG